jgi:membrane-associated phospholipid phosphatase
MLGFLLTLWFELVYGTANYVAAHSGHRWNVHFACELSMPFVPAMTIVYMSIFPLFWLSPFVLQTRGELRSLFAALGVTVFSAGVVFFLFPAELAYEPAEVPARWTWLFAVADTMNLDYNLVPSLHVAMSTVCIGIYSRRAGYLVKSVLWAWGCAIALSTLLTHQHHLLDVITGLLLAVLVLRMGCRWRQSKLNP